MSIQVNELRDLEIENYNGNSVTVNVEELRFAEREADISPDNMFYNQSKNLGYVYISAGTLLVFDASNPVVRKLAASYTIALANPPLVNFPFDLAFFRRGVTPAPAAVRLMEALRAMGYTGPEVVKLAQINMYMTKITLPSLPAFMACNWNPLSAKTIVQNSWVGLPMSTVNFKTTDEIIMADGPNGVFHITRPGLYQIQGSACFAYNVGYQLICATLNSANPNTAYWSRFFSATKNASDTSQSSFPFTFTLYIADANLLATTSGRAARVDVQLFSSEATTINALGVTTWLTIARLA